MRWFLLLFLSACCDGKAPVWEVLEPVTMVAGGSLTVDLAAQVDSSKTLVFSALGDDELTAEIAGKDLVLQASPASSGTHSVEVEATDECGNVSSSTLLVTIDEKPLETCFTEFRYTARGSPDAVYLAGTFNDWSTLATPMNREGSEWVAQVELSPGAWPYKVVEANGSATAWSCDPESDFVQCDEGYTWDPSCPVGGGGCNSLKVVGDCTLPVLTVSSLKIDRSSKKIQATVTVEGALSEPWATLDGEPLENAWTGDGFTVDASGLSAGRHTLRMGGKGPDGRPAEEVYIPAWLDDRTWNSGLLYYAFVDRFSDGDPTNNAPEGATAVEGDYLGGDWQGVIDRLDYLDSLGVTAIWLTAPWDNAQGPWAADCGVTVTGYHGYWPVSDSNLEEHFGDAAKLKELIDAAHARKMRVLVDWVGNHVHSEHPWVQEHPDWFSPQHICKDDDDGDGQVNWDQRPETCWFASYLPDLRYYEVEPLEAMVDQAVSFAKSSGIDGYRVDAVKHMPQSLHWNMQSRIRREIEHRDAGGDEDFYTVGETFTPDRGLIASYMGERELDGQFDFPLYWAIVSAFARNEIGLSNGEGSLKSVADASEAAFADHTMSTFLGNHDVWRFIAQSAGEVNSLYGDGNCDGSNHSWPPDQAPGWSEPYRRLELAWTFLLTRPGLPLIYYGDEVGLPGWADPDNRQRMRFDGDLSANEAEVLAHVRALGQARREHPALSIGKTTGWWENDPDVYAYARTTATDGALVLLNRSGSPRTLSNGLSYTGLSAGTYVDLLSGETFTSAGDSLTVEIPAFGSRVLVPR